MSSVKFDTAKDWFETLRDKLVNSLEEVDTVKFSTTEWEHKEEGGGKMSKIKGSVIEKGGVNISSVAGDFKKNMIGKVPGTEKDPSYQATGISVVLHPHSPHVPSMHFNTRYLQTDQEWFGGGMDITPCLPYGDEKNYHLSLERMCNNFDKSYYQKYKKWCDEYFYLPHRKESRGIGGIFFDYLHSDDWSQDLEFVKSVGEFFHHYIIRTINSLKDKEWTNEEKNSQLIKRSRYAEFNLLHDRGTRFGLETGGNIDAILMSMPPLAKWD
ncbi:oxygen-dependent coproporphyrinogen oxidase [Alphaproteobacteria bacterium]|jgi:coproporphyrinogen III oxidase|nr:oxygen-dependent coproporphyrinogen oxidase [Alphaproteobacteria bacterium]